MPEGLHHETMAGGVLPPARLLFYDAVCGAGLASGVVRSTIAIRLFRDVEQWRPPQQGAMQAIDHDAYQNLRRLLKTLFGGHMRIPEHRARVDIRVKPTTHSSWGSISGGREFSGL